MRVSFTLVFLIGIVPAGAMGQRAPQTDSLARVAREALNNLQYDRAEQLARTMIEGENTTRDARVQGLQLLAAAFFPEEDGAQRPDSATEYLRQLLEISPAVTMPAEISWPGLDAMLDATARAVFYAVATPQDRYVLDGVGAEAVIPVVATRRAVFTLATRSAGDGSRVVIDSTLPATSADLRFKVAQYTGVSMAAGSYELWVTAVDSLTGQAVEMGFDAVVDAPPLGLVPIPVALDSSLLLPEKTSRHRVRNTLIGIGLGAATGFIATAFRGSDPVSSIGLDNRAYVMGGGMTLGGIIGVLTDRAAPVPENIAHNAGVRADHAEFVRLSREQNDARRLSYQATVTIRGRMQ